MRSYIKDIEDCLAHFPFKLSSQITIDNRGDIALYIKAKVVFTDFSELHVTEYLLFMPNFDKIAYSYHYQDKDKKLIFRYDNAEHHTEVETYPHHKHIPDSVIPSRSIVLQDILNEISAKNKF